MRIARRPPNDQAGVWAGPGPYGPGAGPAVARGASVTLAHLRHRPDRDTRCRFPRQLHTGGARAAVPQRGAYRPPTSRQWHGETLQGGLGRALDKRGGNGRGLARPPRRSRSTEAGRPLAGGGLCATARRPPGGRGRAANAEDGRRWLRGRRRRGGGGASGRKAYREEGAGGGAR